MIMRNIYFNGKELKVKSLKTTIKPLTNVSNSYTQNKNILSQKFISSQSQPKLISLEFPFEYKKENDVEKLISDFFYSENEVELIHPLKENEYFLVKVEGEIETTLNGTIILVTVNLYCSDGFARSKELKTFELQTNENGKLFKIDNRGTYKSRPSFEFEVLKDTDGFGLVTDNEVLQLGTIDTVDFNETEAQTLIWKDDLEPVSKPKWQSNTAKPNFSTADDRQSQVKGVMTWANSAFYPSDYGSIDLKAPGYWHGPSESRYIGEQLDNWDLYTRLTFRPTPKGVTGVKRSQQQGLLEVNMYDEDNQLVCGFHFKDNTQASDLVEFRVYLSGLLVYENKLPRAMHTEDGGFYGFLWIRKMGNRFNLELVKTIGNKQTYKKVLNFTNEDAARLKANRVDYWMSTWKDRIPLDMRVSYSTLLKTNVEDEKDIPLKFYEGDTVLIEGDTGKIYINGSERADYFITGSKFIECHKGITDVYLLADDESVTGKAILEEKYL